MKRKTEIMCPAHRCKSGSQLLGIRQDNGVIAILPQTLSIDESFIKKVKKHPVSPERRFRFANKCIEGGCKQWDGEGCSVANKIIRYLNELPSIDTIPSCSIRSTCRWYIQEGNNACKVCVFVVTEVYREDFIKNI